tara:strand:- start:2326 stop:2700 length:375 start_codon:yes stop_codon:yes gene_type:complete
MKLVKREEKILEAVLMHPKRGGRACRGFVDYVAGATGYSFTTSRETLSKLKRLGLLEGKQGEYRAPQGAEALESGEAPQVKAVLRTLLSLMRNEHIEEIRILSDGTCEWTVKRVEEHSLSLESG